MYIFILKGESTGLLTHFVFSNPMLNIRKGFKSTFFIISTPVAKLYELWSRLFQFSSEFGTIILNRGQTDRKCVEITTFVRRMAMLKYKKKIFVTLSKKNKPHISPLNIP